MGRLRPFPSSIVKVWKGRCLSVFFTVDPSPKDDADCVASDSVVLVAWMSEVSKRGPGASSWDSICNAWGQGPSWAVRKLGREGVLETASRSEPAARALPSGGMLALGAVWHKEEERGQHLLWWPVLPASFNLASSSPSSRKGKAFLSSSVVTSGSHHTQGGWPGRGNKSVMYPMPSTIKQIMHSCDTEVKEGMQGKVAFLLLSSKNQLLSLLGILPDSVYA